MHEPIRSPAARQVCDALIVDDESPARERLRRLLEETRRGRGDRRGQQRRRSARPLRRLDPDVVLLDVRMPGMDGIEAARHLSALDEPPAVIFTTAHDEYALEAFETQAVGYLLKPVRKEKLARAVRHAARIAGQQLRASPSRRSSAVAARRSARGSASSCG